MEAFDFPDLMAELQVAIATVSSRGFIAGRRYIGGHMTLDGGQAIAKPLDKGEAIWHSLACGSSIGVLMQKSFFAIIGAALSVVVVSSTAAHSGTYPFGDEPYRLNWGYDPEIESGCWKWNWQLHQWNDYCPRYVNPKAYMYPRSSRVVLRTKG